MLGVMRACEWILVIGCVLAGCSEDTGRHSKVPADAGPGADAATPGDAGMDLGARDASGLDGGMDQAGGDQGGAATDPALCPVGAADGCCPLLRYGGTDPDCKPLDCQLQPSAPIPLEDHTRSGEWRGQVALAWNGRELALARTDTVASGSNVTHELVFERRDYAGNLSFGPVRTTQPIASGPGHTSLAYEPVSHTYLFLDSISQAFEATGLSADGAIAWNHEAYQICNGIDGIGDAFAQGGRFIVAGDQYTCAGSTSQPILVEYGSDGTLASSRLIGDGAHPEDSWYGAEGCDLDCQHLLSIWDRSYEGSLRGRVLDTSTEMVGTGFDLEPVSGTYVDHSGVASDGTQFFVYTAIQSGTGTMQSFRRYQLSSGFVDAGYSIAGPRALPPSVIWTGSGWLVAAATFTLDTSTAFPDDHHAYAVQLWQFDAQGQLVATWQNETDAGYYPQLAWAGGRIALSWVRVPASGDEQRLLRYLDCP